MLDNEHFSANIYLLHILFEMTTLTEDEEVAKDAFEVLHELCDEYGAQCDRDRMSDLRETLLARGRYAEPGGLRFREEVEIVILSLLNRNPTRCIDLGVLAKLLQCEVLWSEVDALAEDDLPDHVLQILGDIQLLISAPESDATEGQWWTVDCFDDPWWENPPPVAMLEGLTESPE